MEILTEAEISAAKEFLSNRKRSQLHRKKESFKNNLLMFSSRILQHREHGERKIIYAIDTSEIFPSEEKYVDDAFAFSPYVVDENSPGPRELGNLSRLDELIREKLLFSDRIPISLLDAHADELSENRERRRSAIPMYDLKGLSLSTTEADQILKLLESGDDEDTEKLASALSEDFFPWLQIHQIESFRRSAKELSAISQFLNHSNFGYMKPKATLERHGINISKSVESVASRFFEDTKLDLSAFQRWSNTSLDEEEAEVAEKIEDLLDTIRPRRASNTVDALAMAQAHVLNKFFERTNVDIEISIVTRTPALHEVMSSLPMHRLRLSVVHPMFVPEVYSTGEDKQLFGDILRSTRNLISLPLDNDGIGKPEQTSSVEARKIVRYFSSVVSYDADLSSVDLSEGKNTEIGLSAQKILDSLRKRLSEGKDPLATATWRSVSEDLIRAVNLVTKNKESVQFSTIRLTNFGETTKRDTLAARLVHPYFGVIFHYYTPLMINMLSNSRDEFDHEEITSADIDIDLRSSIELISQFFDEHDYFEEAINIEIPDSKFEKIMESFEIVHYSSVILAGAEQFEVSASIVSQVLSPISALIRENRAPRGLSRNLSQLYATARELYILRHHCERSVALKHSLVEQSTGKYQLSEEVDHNLSRAQRDLDFSVLLFERMNVANARLEEEIPDLESSDDEFRISGNEARLLSQAIEFPDARNLISHIGGWIDHFLILLASDFKGWPPMGYAGINDSIRARGYLWNLAGMAKDASSLSAHYHKLALNANEGSEEREYYLYFEKRLLQYSLLLFIVHFAGHLSKPMRQLLRKSDERNTEKLFVFRDWHDWWERYRQIEDGTSGTTKMKNIINVVCGAVESVQSGKDSEEALARLHQGLNTVVQEADGRRTMEHLALLIDRNITDAKNSFFQ